jgi:hypothetical protein
LPPARADFEGFIMAAKLCTSAARGDCLMERAVGTRFTGGLRAGGPGGGSDAPLPPACRRP